MRGAGVVLAAVLAFASPVAGDPVDGDRDDDEGKRQSLVVVIPVDYPGQIHGAVVLAESLRTFGGTLAQVPIRLVAPAQLESALADTKVKEVLNQAYFELICEEYGVEDTEKYKKKAEAKLSGEDER